MQSLYICRKWLNGYNLGGGKNSLKLWDLLLRFYIMENDFIEVNARHKMEEYHVTFLFILAIANV